MEHDSIVFYCKGCGKMFFAAINDPKYYDDELGKEISELMVAGHQMAIVDTETVRANFAMCECEK